MMELTWPSLTLLMRGTRMDYFILGLYSRKCISFYPYFYCVYLTLKCVIACTIVLKGTIACTIFLKICYCIYYIFFKICYCMYYFNRLIGTILYIIARFESIVHAIAHFEV